MAPLQQLKLFFRSRLRRKKKRIPQSYGPKLYFSHKPFDERNVFMAKIPREIRNKIYRYVLDAPCTLTIDEHYSRRHSRNLYDFRTTKASSWTYPLGLLLTCSLFYNECKDLFWKYNTLELKIRWHTTCSRASRLLLITLPYVAELDYDKPFSQYLATNVRSAVLDMKWLRLFNELRPELGNFMNSMEGLKLWTAKGQLRHITLKLPFMVLGTLYIHGYLVECWNFEKIEAVIRVLKKKYFSECEIALQVDRTRGNYMYQPDCPEFSWASTGKGGICEEVYKWLRAFSSASGGKLYWNGELCFDNGEEVNSLMPVRDINEITGSEGFVTDA